MFDRLEKNLKYKPMITTEHVKLSVSELGSDLFPGVALFKTEYLF